MKNLLTKTLFISLLFSAITPAIKASDAGISATEADSVAKEEATNAANQAATTDRQFFPEVYPEITPKVLSKVPATQASDLGVGAADRGVKAGIKATNEIKQATSAGFFSGLAAKTVNLKNYAASNWKRGKSYVAKKVSVAGKGAVKHKTGLRYSAYATGIAVAGLVAYKAYNSEKVKNAVKNVKIKAKQAWNNKWVRGYIEMLTATSLGAAGTYIAVSAFQGKFSNPLDLFSTFVS